MTHLTSPGRRRVAATTAAVLGLGTAVAGLALAPSAVAATASPDTRTYTCTDDVNAYSYSVSVTQSLTTPNTLKQNDIFTYSSAVSTISFDELGSRSLRATGGDRIGTSAGSAAFSVSAKSGSDSLQIPALGPSSTPAQTFGTSGAAVLSGTTAESGRAQAYNTPTTGAYLPGQFDITLNLLTPAGAAASNLTISCYNDAVYDAAAVNIPTTAATTTTTAPPTTTTAPPTTTTTVPPTTTTTVPPTTTTTVPPTTTTSVPPTTTTTVPPTTTTSVPPTTTTTVPPTTTAPPTSTPPVAPTLYKLGYADTLFQVSGGRVVPISYAQWQGFGFPAPVALGSVYEKYAFSTTLYAESSVPGVSGTVLVALTPAQWSVAGFPVPSTTGFIGGSFVYQFATGGPELFLQLPITGETHALTFAEWSATGFLAQEVFDDNGFFKLAWDPTIAYANSISGGDFSVISYGQWAQESFPSPDAVQRFEGDVFTQGCGTPVIHYTGPTLDADLSYSQWVAAGSPAPTRPASCTP